MDKKNIVTMYLINYVHPVLEIEGYYTSNISIKSENSNKGPLSYLYTFIAEKIKVLDAKYLPERLKCFVDSNNETTNSLIMEFNSWFAGRTLSPKRELDKSTISKVIFSEFSDAKMIPPKLAKTITFRSMSDKYYLSEGISPQYLSKNIYDAKITQLKNKLAPTSSVKKISGNLGDLIFSRNEYFTNPDIPLYNESFLSTNNKPYDSFELLEDFNYCLGGIMKKRWVKKSDNSIVLQKQGNFSYGQDPVNEYLATKLLDFLNYPDFEYVRYSLSIEGYTICSECENFLNPTEELVPLSDIHFYFQTIISRYHKDAAAIEKIYGYDKELIQKASSEKNIYKLVLIYLDLLKIQNGKNYIDTMIIFDRRTLNFDRHLGNIGLIKDITKISENNPHGFIKMSPLYDMGGCFFSNYNSAGIVVPGKEKPKKMLFDLRLKEMEKNNEIPPISHAEQKIIADIINAHIFIADEDKQKIIEKCGGDVALENISEISLKI